MKILFNTITTKYPQYKPSKLPFKGFDCAEDSFELKNLYNIPCPICGVTMIRRNQIDDFVDSAVILKGEDLIELLKKYERYYHKMEACAVELLIQKAQRSPNSDLKELSSEIYDEIDGQMKNEILEALSRIRKQANSIVNNMEKERAYAVIDEYIALVESGEWEIDKEEFKKKIARQVKTNHSIRRKLSSAIDKMPQTSEDGETFFIKYAQKTPAEIASRLLTPSFATCEHIKPKSQGGENNTSNYLLECEECNSKRGNKPFYDFVIEQPIFKTIYSRLNDYICAIAHKLQTGELSKKYDSYLGDIQQTISTETKGTISLKVPYVIYPEQETADEEFDFSEYLKRFRQNIVKLRQSIAELSSQESEFETNTQFPHVVRYKQLHSTKTALDRKIGELENVVRNKRQAVNSYCAKAARLAEINDKCSKLDDMNKDKPRLLAEAKKIESYMSSKNLEHLEQQFTSEVQKLDELRQQLSEIETELSYEKEQIDFPEEYQAKINNLTRELNIQSGLYSSYMQKKQESRSLALKQKIKEKESELEKLTELNKGMDISDSTGEELVKYRHLIGLIQRVDDVILNATAKKTEGEDTEIYKYAKIAIEKEASELLNNNKSVQYSVNLSKIAQITSQISDLFEELEKAKLEDRQQAILQKNIDELQISISELKSQIEDLKAKQDIAQSLFNASNIKTQMKRIQEEIKYKSDILSQFEQGSINQDEFLELASFDIEY